MSRIGETKCDPRRLIYGCPKWTDRVQKRGISWVVPDKTGSSKRGDKNMSINQPLEDYTNCEGEVFSLRVVDAPVSHGHKGPLGILGGG
jgi:hypothetical protein